MSANRLVVRLAPAVTLCTLVLPATSQPLAPAVSVPAGGDRYEITAVDLDADGNTDLALSGLLMSVWWSAGDGSGTLVDIPTTAPDPQARGRVAAADMDADGDVDLVAANGASQFPGVLLQRNEGARTFSQGFTFVFEPSPTHTTLGDVDDDGAPDVGFVAGNPDEIFVWRNTGDGSLVHAAGYGVPALAVIDLVFEDLDVDGDLDMVSSQFVFGADAVVRLRANDGAGSFGPSFTVPAGGSDANGLTFADVDLDGDPDLLLSRPGNGDVALFTNPGNGAFGAPVSAGPVEEPWQTVLGDLDHDGVDDLVAAAGFADSSVELLRGLGGGTYEPAGGQDTGSLAFRHAVLDLDRDGDLDVAAVDDDELFLVQNTTVDPARWHDLLGGTPGSAGTPRLVGKGGLVGGTEASLLLSRTPASALALVWVSLSPAPFPALGGTVHAWPFGSQLLVGTDAAGVFVASTTWPAGVPAETEVVFQCVVQDVTSVHGLTLSNGLRATTP